ncbi:hypothetical protein MKW98_014152 [Papaver atlanticum]|uniref:3-hydroxyisobutyryl-CoA hydrolase n=1 Tax=Papaver atlanticum TaxID=357466 RepID=A0AAD4SJC9_9MAGN|nr:hypothetical protein MKW98_014152 [Papaver atlanticum]
MNHLSKCLQKTARSSIHGYNNHHYSRCFSAQPILKTHDDDYQNQVLVEGSARSRAAILNRPETLNALTTSMAVRLKNLYESWEDNYDIGFIVMKGKGRAFSAGSDVVTLSRLLNQGKVQACKEFFGTLYRFVYLLGTYVKPHVAIMDGITMGAGAGVSLPGSFRLVTDKTVFATPECQLGFHPDAGGSYYLSRLPGHLGEYLALTGERLDGVDMIACGLATHYILNERLAWIEDRLTKLITDDSSVINSSLEQYGDIVYPNKESVLRRMEIIDTCFGQDTVEEIIEALENEASLTTHDEWYTRTLTKLKAASPLSLKVSLRSVREGRFQTLDKCLAREYRTSLKVISGQFSNDFSEGVRARLVDKDYTPKWDPPSLKDVSKDMVDSYFNPLGDFEPELELPTTVREPYI